MMNQQENHMEAKLNLSEFVNLKLSLFPALHVLEPLLGLGPSHQH